MLHLLPKKTPPLNMLLENIGNPSAKRIAKALKVSERTVRRWLAAGIAPHTAMLSLFWISRWGWSDVNAEAVWVADLHMGMAKAYKRERDQLREQLSQLGRIGEFGSANDPAPDVLPGKPANQPPTLPEGTTGATTGSPMQLDTTSDHPAEGLRRAG
jgi:hypothetical protein